MTTPSISSPTPKRRRISEIAHNSNVCLAFADPKSQRYVSVTGTAEVFANSALAERVWRTADKAFWKDAYDPRIRVIRVTPDQGEYWEGSGMVLSVVSMLIAGAKGSRPESRRRRQGRDVAIRRAARYSFPPGSPDRAE